MPSLLIDVEARYAQFRDTMDRVGRDAERTGKRITSAFGGVKTLLAGLGVGLSVGALAASIKSVANEADRLSKTAQRIGIAVESLAALEHVASLSDLSVGSLSNGVKKLSEALVQAKANAGEGAKAFRALGIDPRPIEAADDALLAIADRFAQMPNGIEKTTLAMKLFGKAGLDWIPLLNQGAAGIKATMEEAKRLGLVLSADVAASAERFNDSITRLTKIGEGMKRQFIGPLIPLLADFGEGLFASATGANGLHNEMLAMTRTGRDVVDFAEKVAYGLAFMGDAAAGAKDVIAEAGSQIAVLAKNIETAGKVLALSGGILPNPVSFAKNFDEIQRVLNEDAAFTDAANEALAGRLNRKQFRASVGEFFDEQRRTVRVLGQKFVLDTQAQAEQVQRAYDEFLSSAEGRKFLRNRGAAPDLGEVAGAPGAGDLAKAALDANLKALERTIAVERELLGDRNQMLERYNSANLISFKAYYDARAAAQAEATEKSRAAYDDEIALLQKRLSTAPEKERLALQEKIAEAVAKRARLEQDAASQGVQAWLNEKRAAEQYNAQIIDITARLAELRGDTSKAVLLRFDVQNAAVRQRLEVEASDPAGDEASRARARGALEELDAIRALTEAHSRMNELRGEAEAIQARLRTTEESLSVDREAGIITELAMMGQLGEARAASVADLARIADEMRAIAALSNDPKMLDLAKAFGVQVKQIEASADVLGRKFESVFEGAFTDNFAAVLDGTKKLSTAFNDMANDILRAFSRIIAQNIAERIFGGASGLASGLTGLFSSANGSAYAAGGAITPFAAGGAFSNTIVRSPTLFRFMRGGQMQLGEMGEAGPEAIMPLKSDGAGRLGVLVAGSSKVLPLARDGSGRLAVQFTQADGGAAAKKFAAGGVFERARGVFAGAAESVTRVSAGPSATTGTPGSGAMTIRPLITPEMADITMRDWVETWLARELATR